MFRSCVTVGHRKCLSRVLRFVVLHHWVCVFCLLLLVLFSYQFRKWHICYTANSGNKKCGWHFRERKMMSLECDTVSCWKIHNFMIFAHLVSIFWHIIIMHIDLSALCLIYFLHEIEMLIPQFRQLLCLCNVNSNLVVSCIIPGI